MVGGPPPDVRLPTGPTADAQGGESERGDLVPKPSSWDAVVQAAAEEFRERGYENATLAGVSHRVGLSKASLYHYIDTKDDLLWAVIDAPARELVAGLDALLEHSTPVSARLRELFRVQVGIFADHHPAAFVYLAQVGREDQPAHIAQLERRYVDGVEALIREGVVGGEFGLTASPSVAARALIGMLDWMMHWYSPNGAVSPRELADQLFSIAVGGLVSGAQILALLPELDAEPSAQPSAE